MKRAILITTLVLASIGLAKPAMSTTWNEVKNYSEDIQIMYLFGVYEGYVGTHIYNQAVGNKIANLICVPKNGQRVQIAKVVINHLNKNPREWNKQLFAVALGAWGGIWPCK